MAGCVTILFMQPRIKLNAFGSYIIVHPSDDLLAWSGARWVPANEDGLAAGPVHVCNFSGRSEAAEYWQKVSPKNYGERLFCPTCGSDAKNT